MLVYVRRQTLPSVSSLEEEKNDSLDQTVPSEVEPAAVRVQVLDPGPLAQEAIDELNKQHEKMCQQYRER